MDKPKMGRFLPRPSLRAVIAGVTMLLATLLCPFNIFSESFTQIGNPLSELPDSIPVSTPVDAANSMVVVDSINAQGAQPILTPADSLAIFNSPLAAAELDSVAAAQAGYPGERVRVFNPDPTRAVWLSALFPGLGQVYNRRYWKLPIVAGAFVGLGYGTSWNNNMLRDYTRAYNDLLDNDPTTNSYMDLFPSTTTEADLDKSWLRSVLKSRKDYFRRNRDLCIICMVGVYLVAMVDAYVDASLAHFDISPNLSMDVAPAVIPDSRSRLPGVGVQWALNF